MVNSRTGAANIQNEPGVPENKEILKGKKALSDRACQRDTGAS